MGSDPIGPRIAPELAAALARAQGEFPPIRKNRTADVQTRSGGSYRYGFADLATVLAAVRPALARHELALTQNPNVRIIDGATFVGVETILAHSSGASIATVLELSVGDSTPQAIGSGLTFARRYSILALLGIAAEEDDDAEAARGAPQAPRSQRDRRPAPSTQSEAPRASENQVKLVWGRARERARAFVAEGDADAEKQLSEEIVRSALPKGVESTKDLTPRQVDGVLERIAAFVMPESAED